MAEFRFLGVIESISSKRSICSVTVKSCPAILLGEIEEYFFAIASRSG